MKLATAAEIHHTTDESPKHQKAEKKAGRRDGYNYIILKSLKESRKNDVVKCLYIKSLTRFGICVIKEGSYGESMDRYGRDIKDRLLWQKQLHESLQGKVRLPRLLGTFEENGNYYLILEHIKGKSFFKACQEKNKELRDSIMQGNRLGLTFLGYLLQIIDIIETLHRNQVIHRDATATNFMVTPRGKVTIIDMELAYSLTDTTMPPYELGTYGYMSPEQLRSQTPTIKEDIFSIGAILLQIWIGSIGPHKLTQTSIDDLCQKVNFFVPDQKLGDLIIQCLHPDPGSRPLCQTIRTVINDFRLNLKKNIARPSSNPKYFSKEEILQVVQSTINSLATPLFADPERGWFSENSNNQNYKDKTKIEKTWYTNFNSGVAGIIYFLSYAKKVGFDTSIALPYVYKGLELIQTNYIEHIHESSPGLYFGSDGIATALAAAMKYKLIEQNSDYTNWIELLLKKQTTVTNIAYGVAGQGLSNLYCRSFIDERMMHDRLEGYIQILLSKQAKDGSWVNESSDNKKRVTRGFASGVAGIIYFLLEYASQFSDVRARHAAENGLNWLMNKSIMKEGKLRWLSSTGKKLPSTWYEGTAGIGLTFLRAYHYTNNSNYKKLAELALYSQPKLSLVNNLSLCHGLSGTAEIYMEAQRILQHQEWDERISNAIQVIMHLKQNHVKFGPYWLVEDEHQPVGDFMTGNTGILHCLIRYCFSNEVQLPLQF